MGSARDAFYDNIPEAGGFFAQAALSFFSSLRNAAMLK